MDFTIDMLNQSKENLFFARRRFEEIPKKIEKYVNDKGENILDRFAGFFFENRDEADEEYIRDLKRKNLMQNFLLSGAVEVMIVFRYKGFFYNCQDDGMRIKSSVPLDTETLFGIKSFSELNVDFTKLNFAMDGERKDSVCITFLPEYKEIFNRIKNNYLTSGTIFSSSIDVYHLSAV